MTTIYLKLDKNMKITGRDFCLKEIAQVRCSDKAVETKAKLLKLPALQITGPGRYVFSIMDIIDVLQKEFPSAEIQNLGETDFVLTLEKDSPPSAAWQWTKTLLVCIMTFFGAAFSIMAFNNDVGITELFGQLYTLFTGDVSNGFTVLEFSYSLGLGIGILVYFNHFGKKKITADPTPLEVEMRMYEDQIDDTLIEADSRSPQKTRS
ncbi:MAG: stage V sporulation protein AA [Lachnospiraceae bacterium]|nr:stage V sporulation protein AA [Lachnospiraceae bacterium]